MRFERMKTVKGCKASFNSCCWQRTIFAFDGNGRTEEVRNERS